MPYAFFRFSVVFRAPVEKVIAGKAGAANGFGDDDFLFFGGVEHEQVGLVNSFHESPPCDLMYSLMLVQDKPHENNADLTHD